MKKLFLFIIFTSIFTSITFPQWTDQNPVPNGNHLWSTFFVNNNTGWIVGSDGFIKKTTNSGLDWIEQNSGTNVSLRSVYFADENTGWICGDNGLILKTINGGQNWFTLPSGTTSRLTSLHFISMQTGYAVGFNETILKTTDGGENWVVQLSGSEFDLNSVKFVNENIGYAVGGRDSSKFLKTIDGGTTWNVQTLDLGGFETEINCVEFVDANTGFIGTGTHVFDYGKISKTTDGGETWFSSTLFRPTINEDTITYDHPTENTFDTQRGIRSIFFRDANNGYAVGGTLNGWRRSIYSTTDGGSSWNVDYAYSEQTGLLSIFVNGSGQGLAVGYYGVIYRSEENNNSWDQILSGKQHGYTGDWITSVFMVNDTLGWAAGYRKGIWYYPLILKTTTGGKIWVTNKEFSDHIIATPADVFFVNESTGWVTFYDRGSYKTTDAGATWINVSFNANEKYFVNQDTGWGAMEPLGIFKSTNGGYTWEQKSTVSSTSIYFADYTTGWAVGDGGSIVKSTNEGETWDSKFSGTSSKLNSVNFYDNNKGVTVGYDGTVLLTDDGGETWTLRNSGTSSELNSTVFTGESIIWAVGTGGKIISTTDFGSTWTSFDGITGSNLSSIRFLNQNKGWASGGNSILIYQNEPVQPASHFAPVWSGNGYMNMRIFVTGVEFLSGESLTAGDEIAVFDGDYCVGAIRLTEPIPVGGHIQIIAATDNPVTPQRDGFINGHDMTFKFWLASTMEEVTAFSVQYISGNSTFVSNGTATVQFSNILPVELISFTADVHGSSVLLKWKTASELNNFGFEIERSHNKTDWNTIGFVSGAGSTNSPVAYTYADKSLSGGTKHFYRLKQLDINGSFEYSKVLEIELLPVLFELSQNYPNPFNPSTHIQYSVSRSAKISLIVYDILGSEIVVLVNEVKEPGIYTVEFNTSSINGQIASGIYLYQLKALSINTDEAEFTSVKKMNLIK